MKKLLIFFIFLNSYAIDIKEIQRNIELGKYSRVCNNNIFNTAIKNKDDGLLNLYAIACLKSDYINKLATVIISLRNTPEARANAVYYSTILYKKKLLHAALVDGLDIKGIVLPKCDFILSDIYDDYITGNYVNESGVYIFKYNENKVELSLKKESEITKMVLKIYVNNQIKEVKEYW